MFIGIDLKFSTDDEGAFKIDVADVCDLQPAVCSAAVDYCVFEHETGPVVRVYDLGQVEDSGLRGVLNSTGLDRGNSRVRISSLTRTAWRAAGRAAATATACGRSWR